MAKSRKLGVNIQGRLLIVVVHHNQQGVPKAEFQISFLDRYAMGKYGLKLSKTLVPITERMLSEIDEAACPWQKTKLEDGRRVYAVRGDLIPSHIARRSWGAIRFRSSPQHIDERILDLQELAEEVRELTYNSYRIRRTALDYRHPLETTDGEGMAPSASRYRPQQRQTQDLDF